MKLYELAYLNVEKDKNSINFGIMDKFINGKTSHNLVKKSKQEKEEVICYLNGRAMTKSKLEKTFPKKKKNKSKRKYIKKKKIQFFVPTVKSCSAMPTHVSTIVRLERRRVHARNAPYIVTNPSCANECDR